LSVKDTSRVKLLVETEVLYKNLGSLINSREGLQLINSGDSQQVNLMIVQLGDNYARDFQSVESLIDKGLADEIFLVSEKADANLLRQALTSGAREFFELPLKNGELEMALDRFTHRQMKKVNPHKVFQGKVISVTGSKGGVGTTTVAVNLAVTMAQTDSSLNIVLMDLNTLFGEIPIFLDMTPKFTWADITQDIDRLDPVFLENVLARHSSGVQVLPSPTYLNKAHFPTPQIMEILINQLKMLFDWVIIDMGQSRDDAEMQALQMSDSLLLISIQSLPCLTNTNRLLKSYERSGLINKERIHVVLNHHVKKNDISLDGVEKGIGKELSWILPNDYTTTMSAINHGKTLMDIAPRSAISKSYQGLAAFFMPQAEKKKKRGWLF